MSGVRWWLRACEQPSGSGSAGSTTSVDSQMEDSKMGTGYSGRCTPVMTGPKLGFSGSISSLIGF
jgi:hypothetical protein